MGDGYFAVKGLLNYYRFPVYYTKKENRKLLRQALDYLPDFIHNVKGEIVSCFERAYVIADSNDLEVFRYAKEFNQLKPMEELKETALFFLESSGWKGGELRFSFEFMGTSFPRFIAREIPSFFEDSFIRGKRFFEQRVSGVICGSRIVPYSELIKCRSSLLMPFRMYIRYEKDRDGITDSEVQVEYCISRLPSILTD